MTVTINVHNDTFLAADAPTTNNATDSSLLVGESNTVTGRITRALLHFDGLSDGTIPSNAIVDSADLHMYLTTDRSSNARTFRVYRMLQAWVYNTCTWNKYGAANWPGGAGGFGASDCENTDIGSHDFTATETLNTWHIFPLTASAIQEMISGAFTNVGLMVKADTELNDMWGFTPDSGGNHAYIEVTYHFEGSFSGGLTPAGAMTKGVKKALAGGLTPSGIMAYSRSVLKTLVGAIIPSGGILKTIYSTKAGGITPSGMIRKSAKRYLIGGISPTGSMTKKAAKPLSGSITPGGSLLKQAKKILTGEISPGGILLKTFRTTFAGGITPSGGLTYLKAIIRNFAGAVTPSGILGPLTIKKILAGTVTPGGGLTKAIKKSLGGGITPGGSLTYLKAILRSFAGAVSPGGSLRSSIRKNFTGAVQATGSLRKSASRIFSGAVTFIGDFVGVKPGTIVYRSFAGMVTPSGDLRKGIAKTLTGFVTFLGIFSHGLPFYKIIRFVGMIFAQAKYNTVTSRSAEFSGEILQDDRNYGSISREANLYASVYRKARGG